MIWVVVFILAMASIPIMVKIDANVGFKKAGELMESNGYTVTKTICSLIIDETHHKWMIIHKNQIHDYSDILSVEITENGEKYKMEGGIFRAVVGGALFGGFGAVVGAATSQRARTVNRLSVDIRLNSLDCPLESIVLVKSPIKTDSAIYQKGYENIQKMAAALNIMQNTEQHAAG